MKIWDDIEVKALFENVEKCKEESKSLVQAFAEHAKKFSRKPNSVRNYYYHEVDNLFEDRNRASRLKIDITKHEKAHFENFDKVQEGDLFGEIDKLTAGGLSVRAACLRLSGGDLSLMTRYQNKYQNMKRKIENSENFLKKQSKNPKKLRKTAQKSEILKEIQKFSVLKTESSEKGSDDSKIIPFKLPRTLSDADINSLFLGLVRLIKKTAQDEVFETSNELKQALYKKSSELENLKLEFEKIKKENLALLAKIQLESHANKKLALEKRLEETRRSAKQKSNMQDAKRG